MFNILHLDLFQLIFDYLSQQDLINSKLINHLFLQRINKYINNTKFLICEYDFDTKKAFRNNLIISIKLNDRYINWNHALSYASQSGNEYLVEYTIKKGAYNWRMGLHGALQSGNLKLSNMMLEKYPDFIPHLCLYNACSGGNESIVNLFIDKSTTIFQRELNATCTFGHLTLLKLLIEKCSAETYNIFLRNSLFYACEGGNKLIINFLIEKGARCWDYGLFGACQKGNIEIAKYMIEKGANDFENSLQYACKSGNIELVKLIINNIHNLNIDILNNCLFYARSINNINIVELLFDKGANLLKFDKIFFPNCMDYTYTTPEMVNFLIKKGANDWNHGLRKFSYNCSEKTLNLLIEKGANNFNEGLVNACSFGNLKIAELMISKGADDFNDGLRAACENGHIKLVDLMIEHGANDWDLALQHACICRDSIIIKKIIKKGATHCINCNVPIELHQ